MVTVDNKLDAELDLPISNSAFSQALAFAFGCASPSHSYNPHTLAQI